MSSVQAPGAARRRPLFVRPKLTAEQTPPPKAQRRRWIWSVRATALVVIAALLAVVGLIFVASASSVTSLHASGHTWGVFYRQVVWVAFGAVALTAGALIPYRAYWTLGPIIYAGAVFCTLLTLTPLGIEKNGSQRWIGSVSLGFQPSEIVKLGSVLLLAGLFATQTEGRVIAGNTFLFKRLTPVLALSLLPVLKQPDMGTATVIALASGAVIFASGMHWTRIAQGLSLGFIGAAVYAMSAPYRLARIVAFLNAGDHTQGAAWHVEQSKLGFASGRLLGVGIGASRAKWGFVPNAHTDFIFAIIGEELGLLGAATVLGLFVCFMFVGLSVVNNAKDRFGALIAVGIVVWIMAQATINMGTVLGVMPVTGVPLPFVSYGGTSLLVIAFAFGILVNIARVSGPARRPAPRSNRRRPDAARAAAPVR